VNHGNADSLVGAIARALGGVVERLKVRGHDHQHVNVEKLEIKQK